MNKLVLLSLVLSLVNCLYGQFLTPSKPGEVSSEENAGQQAGPKGTTCPCGWTNKPSRIIGGKLVAPNEFPLMVGIMDDYVGLFCGGSIITDRHVLTAAHCTEPNKKDRLRVVVGTNKVNDRSSSKQVIEVDYTIEHESYNNPQKYANDVAILVLKTAIKFNQHVGPVCLPKKYDDIDLVGKFIKVIGWGVTDNKVQSVSENLMKVNLKAVDMDQCFSSYSRSNFFLHKYNQICTYREKKDSCSGDSGGPLVWNDPETNRLTQVALVSYGKALCGIRNTPAVNTNVAQYLTWILRTVAGTGVGSSTCHKV